MTNTEVAIFYLVYGIFTTVVAGGMLFSDLQAIYPKDPVDDVIMSLVVGALCGLTWPLGLPLAMLMSGGAKNGIWWRGGTRR